MFYHSGPHSTLQQGKSPESLGLAMSCSAPVVPESTVQALGQLLIEEESYLRPPKHNACPLLVPALGALSMRYEGQDCASHVDKQTALVRERRLSSDAPGGLRGVVQRGRQVNG